MKIYTKTGDQGTTSLIGGERVSKTDPRVEAYGTVDELSAHIALLHDSMDEQDMELVLLRRDLEIILNVLMSVQSLLAVGKGGQGKIPELGPDKTAYLEQRIDTLTATLPAITSFTIPCGDPLISMAHICRTVCRRAERAAIRAQEQFDVSVTALVYLNRLSDYLYTLGRKITDLKDVKEILWKP